VALGADEESDVAVLVSELDVESVTDAVVEANAGSVLEVPRYAQSISSCPKPTLVHRLLALTVCASPWLGQPSFSSDFHAQFLTLTLLWHCQG